MNLGKTELMRVEDELLVAAAEYKAWSKVYTDAVSEKIEAQATEMAAIVNGTASRTTTLRASLGGQREYEAALKLNDTLRSYDKLVRQWIKLAAETWLL